ncbi:hypothetical protein [uncultured Gimesia sp.]|uniref:hypothetical protein n=1 Tax=uncultured Gimesia sp. TaxID=1678688 RepID=UPI0030DB0213|tara:strand:- start:291410 stop:293719 length:2310 start_codon:yes stop_codon:yes gene_type:complete
MKSSLIFQFNTIFSLLLLVLHASQPAVAAEETQPFEVKQIHVGFDGLYKVGRWVPIVVDLTTTAPLELQLSIVALSPDGNPTEVPSKVYSLPKQGDYQLYAQFKSGLLDSPLKIRLRDVKTQSILREISYSPQSSRNKFTAIGLKQSVELWALIGETPGFDPVSAETPDAIDKNRSQFTTLISDKSILPETAYGYDSLDSLIIDADYSVSVEKNRAIRNWVANGGHLVICVGNNVEAYQKSEFAKWVPVKVTGKNRVRELSSLELFAAVRSRIRGVATAAQIEIDAGEVLASSLNGPLLVRVPFGLGVVTFLALDLNTSPLVNWDGLTNLCPKLATRLKQSGSSNQQNDVLGKRISQTGISELETQVFHSQQNFPDVQRPSHWWVMGLILFYLLLVGPLDYFLVHRILNKPHVTWITFPTLVLLAVVWGVTTAQNDNGNTLQSTQLNLVDYDASTGQLRGRFYLNLYSPEMRRYQVNVASTVPGTQNSAEYIPTHLCWNGLPETTFAGMYRSAEGTITGPAYQFAKDSQSIINLPILKWGTKSLRADWSRQQPDLVESRLTGNSIGQLSGTLTHQFSSPLKEWVIAYRNRVYLPVVNPEQLEDSFIPAGQSWNINAPRIESRNIKGYLTRAVSRRIEQKGQHNATIITVQTDYDPLSKDTYEILKMLTFHEMSGGFGYTRLTNLSAEQLDLTEQLRLGRAVLFARLDTPLSQVQLDDQQLDQKQQSTFIRVVIPVKKSTDIQYELPSVENKDDDQPKDQKDTPSGSDKE